METAEDIPPVAGRSRHHRSKVGNGKLLPMTDGRSASYRRFKDLVFDFAADLGGMSQLSTAEVQLIRRAAMRTAGHRGKPCWRLLSAYRWMLRSLNYSRAARGETSRRRDLSNIYGYVAEGGPANLS